MLGNDSTTIDIPQSTEYAKEMRKHEANHSRFGAPGRPFVFQEYPKMMYRAEYIAGKGVQTVESRTVNDSTEELNLKSRGFHFGPDKAHAAAEHDAHVVAGTEAAKREWEIQHGRLSEQAVAEVRAHEADAGAVHLPMIPVTPIKPRKARATKAEMAARKAAQ